MGVKTNLKNLRLSSLEQELSGWTLLLSHTHTHTQLGEQCFALIMSRMRSNKHTHTHTHTQVVRTFLRGVADDDLPASLAGLLHRQRRAEALLVLPQALAFFEAVLLHDLMGHRTSVGGGGFVVILKLFFTILYILFGL